jgi:hypothetical protein
MCVVKKEEKEAKVREFISRARVRVTGEGDESANQIRLVALSLDSPAARAVFALSNEIIASRCALQVILAHPPGAPGEAKPAGDELPLPSGFDRLASIRICTDARLLDAHEQLLIGPRDVWVGDCMRRDPTKRDAYECYSSECAETAVRADRAFRRLWTHSVPLRRGVGPSGALERVIADHPMAQALAAMGEPITSLGMTRH